MEHNFYLENEAALRLGIFTSLLVIMAVLESVFPRRIPGTKRASHCLNNLGLVAINSLLLRLLLPITALNLAALVQEKNWGLLNQTNLSVYTEIIIGFVLLDFLIYWQHRMFHKVPVLWRLHRVHHADQDFDFTTGTRFHPLEIFLSMFVKFAGITVLGAPILSVLIFEIVLNGAAMFNHGNIMITGKIDRFLRLLIVTPDMHRVHHSVLATEYNTNFGFNLPWWDRIFSTYQAQPAAGHREMEIGLNQFKDIRVTNRILGMLVMPFKK